jgi:F-box-like
VESPESPFGSWANKPLSQAAKKVLEITELLETILSRLELRDLVVAQRVCKRWHSLINVSPKLQRAMFMLPSFSRADVVFNPALDDLFQDSFGRNILRKTYHYRPDPNHVPRAEYKLTAKDWICSPTFMRPDASWRRMLPTQPPMTRGVVLLAGCYQETFSQEPAVPMGMLMDPILEPCKYVRIVLDGLCAIAIVPLTQVCSDEPEDITLLISVFDTLPPPE